MAGGDIHTFTDKTKAERRAEKTRRYWPGYDYSVVAHPTLPNQWAIMVDDGGWLGYVDRPRQQSYGRRRSNLKATWLSMCRRR